MVQLPGLGKRRAEPAAAEGHVPPPSIKAEVEEGFGDENVPLYKRVKAAQASPPPQDVLSNVLDEPSPLGLRLRKSPSLLDLIQMRLAQVKSAAGQSAMENSISEPPKKNEIKSGALTDGERLKASNFPAYVLKIGTWEYTSHYEGDLVAKCYFAKHKLVWEILDDGLKSKIEIQWSDITALKATCPENENGTLELVLARPPLFFKECDPQPRKHTLWQAASDFTGGQASLHRKHVLQGPSSLLSKNFEKLIQCDQRLNQLSQQPDIILDSPVFEPICSIFENPNKLKRCIGYKDLKYEHEAPLPKFTNHVSSCPASSMSKKDGVKDLIVKPPELFPEPMNFGVGDVRSDLIAQELKNPNWWNHLKVPGLTASMYVDDLVNHLGNCITEQRTTVNTPLPDNEALSKELPDNEAPSKELLEEIAQCLFSDTHCSPASDEKYLMARVGSLCCLLEEETAPATIPKPEPNDKVWIDVDEVDVNGFDEELSSAPAMKTVDCTEPTAISRKDSFGEMLLNLPRIASIPQFLFNIPEDSDN